MANPTRRPTFEQMCGEIGLEPSEAVELARMAAQQQAESARMLERVARLIIIKPDGSEGMVPGEKVLAFDLGNMIAVWTNEAGEIVRSTGVPFWVVEKAPSPIITAG